MKPTPYACLQLLAWDGAGWLVPSAPAESHAVLQQLLCGPLPPGCVQQALSTLEDRGWWVPLGLLPADALFLPPAGPCQLSGLWHRHITLSPQAPHLPLS